ncbi:hypothetical protein GCM10012275_29260 [Longimycelium tulufanense]|uniref:Uncharacterized protein n=1 Tax=Longimycelium tulufanense TaxID=907463 RepID=A0A8J3CD34_9PSEU|nr:nitroreductase family deazaflavin-dependent oxidoreductase [Longimycelium tulufanense]GGM56320.1 hypothetical protein GCM10012275_29260 [Longimycelium tulufanense]
MSLLMKLGQRLGQQEWLASVGRKLVPLDLVVQRRTRGRVSLLGLVGIPPVVLTTTGRRSGKPREVPLLPVKFRNGYLVTGSNWGQAHHPAWSENLLAHPDAEILLRGRRIPVRGRLLEGAERAEAWAAITKVWPGYDTYDERSGDRQIRVFLLEPR